MCLSIKVNHPEVVLGEGKHLGFEWIVVYNNLGYRCGYVKVPKGHSWHGKDYDDIVAEVHGGLTFAEHDVKCKKVIASIEFKSGAEVILSKSDEETDNAYWVGFDCAHSGDAPDPSLPTEYRMPNFGNDTVKTQEYVESECRSLCEQAAAAK